MRALLVLVLGGGGAVWALHLFAAYFLVALGCPRAWPGLGWWIAAATAGAAATAAGVAVIGVRAQRRARTMGDADAGAVDTRRLILSVGSMLAALFTVAIMLGGLAAVALPPCQGMAGTR